VVPVKELPEPQFIDKVRGIVGLHLNPPEAAVVLCVGMRLPAQPLSAGWASFGAAIGRGCVLR